MNTGQTHICFYSNKCQWSKAFLTELSKTPWKGQFRFICVDPSPSRPALPNWLKKVPTLVIQGDSEPVKTDSDVMNWLYEKKMKEGMNGGGGGGGGPEAAGAGGDPKAFSLAEDVSFAKGFGYSGLDVDTSSQGDGGMTIPGAFSFLGGAAAIGDRMSQELGAPSPANNPRRSKKEELFDKQMEQYQREREMGMPKGPGRM
jgi:hypothetical protein